MRNSLTLTDYGLAAALSVHLCRKEASGYHSNRPEDTLRRTP